MKNLIIIAAGGMGRTFYDIARESLGYGTEFVIKGFITFLSLTARINSSQTCAGIMRTLERDAAGVLYA